MNTDKIYAESIAKEYAKKVIGSGNAMFNFRNYHWPWWYFTC